MMKKYWFEKFLYKVSKPLFVAWMKKFRPKIVERAKDEKLREMARAFFVPWLKNEQS